MLIHLHTHSYFSFLRGIPSPLALAEATADCGMPAIGLTDWVTLSGAVEFVDACKTVGVRPILGLELPILGNARLLTQSDTWRQISAKHGLTPVLGNVVFLAQNMTGWSNLCELSSVIQTRPGLPGISIDQLEMYSAGLICLTGGRRGLLAKVLSEGFEKDLLSEYEQLRAIFDDRLYLEISPLIDPMIPDQVRWFTNSLRISKWLSIPTVATVDIYYLNPEQNHLKRLLTALRTNSSMDAVDEDELALPSAYFHSEEHIRSCLTNLPVDKPDGMIARSNEIADRCKLELPLGTPHYPAIELPGNSQSRDVLAAHAFSGALQQYGEITPEIESRLIHELATIDACGYSSLFLIMEKIVAFARQAGIPIASRGSAASSLVAHCLGITTPDPIKLNLYFERFLNPRRVTPPDIDTDICSQRRDEVIQFVYHEFGADRVAMVSTINRLRSRSALREVAKAYGFSQKKINQLIEKLPWRWYGLHHEDPSTASPYAELADILSDPREKSVLHDASQLIGFPHHLSIHPGGVVIAPGRLTELVPVQLASKGILITQFDLTSLERMGLLKIDLLGIRGLSVLGDVAKMQTHRHPGRYNYPIEMLDQIPDNDDLTAETVSNGRTIGCFQIESPGMRSTLREIQARSPEDIMVALALFRPGPLTGGLKHEFVQRFREDMDRKSKNQAARLVSESIYIHPTLEPLLKETYGVILYQEQVLRIASELAGFSLDEADLLRRAMSHFDLDKQMENLKERFIAGAFLKHQIAPQTSEKIWDLMAAFAGYGFPKAHAASYAQVAWRSAWCKTHFPEMFMAAVLANWGGYYSQRVYLTEARRMGLKLRAPNVNYAAPEFSLRYIDDQAFLFMGLNQVRDLTRRTQRSIINHQPFSSFEDFLSRVDPRHQEVNNLILAGALDDFGEIPVLLNRLRSPRMPTEQLSLFELPHFEFSDRQVEWSLAEKVAAQEAILGVSLLAHPLELLAETLRSSGCISTVDAISRIGQQVKVAGVCQTFRRVRTRRGESIYYLSIEDLDGILAVVVPGGVFRKYQSEFSRTEPVIVEGTVVFEQDDIEPSLRASRLEKIVFSGNHQRFLIG